MAVPIRSFRDRVGQHSIRVNDRFRFCFVWTAAGLSQTRIGEIVRGKRRITIATGLRLSRSLGVSERFWINAQADYDIEREHDAQEDDLNRVEVLVGRFPGEGRCSGDSW